MIFKRRKQQQPKACVVGLDGVPHSMLKNFMSAGVMPNTRDITSRGVLTPMTVTLPEISSVSWSSFMTGKNPGEHGIFGFTDVREGTYQQVFPSFNDLKAETLWDTLGKAGKRSVVINQPATYPVRPIEGALISGFVAIQLERSVYPPTYLKTVRNVDYKIDLDASEVKNNPPLLFRRLDELLQARRRIMDEFWKAEDWSFMEVIVTGTDRLHHFLFDAYEDEDHPHHEGFLAYYRKVDEFVGYVFEKFAATGFGDNFFILSDHGFCRTEKEVYTNSILAEHGYLKFTNSKSSSLEDISDESTAFALDPARVYIHRAGRYSRGSVAEADVARLKSELAGLFASLRDGDKDVVRKVFDGGEAYSGPHACKGPDLLLVPYNGYDFKGRIGSPGVFGERRLQGMHTWDDAFFITTRKDLMHNFERTDQFAPFNLLDVTPRILKCFENES